MKKFYFDVTDSTNLRAREYIKNNGFESAVFIANAQTAGRGRQGKSFYSPKDTGLYLSYAYAVSDGFDTVGVTTSACVAVARAIESVCKIEVGIKWVNDLYFNGKKVCGILTEAVRDFKKNKITHIVIGVGINLSTTLFPDDIKQTAGALGCDVSVKNALADAIINNLQNPSESYIDYYRAHLLGVGQQIIYIENNIQSLATVVGVDDRGGLIINENGVQKTLRSGEITIRK